MAAVDFVFTNPAHHYGMMRPVAHTLSMRGHTCRLISLAELRGLESPSSNGVPVVRAIPWTVRRSPRVGDSLGEATSNRRRLVQQLAWHSALGPRMRRLTRDSDVIVIPNDAVFPYAQLTAGLSVPFVLLQEGIRFPLPNERDVAVYGRAGAAAICCWGTAAAEHFSSIGAPTRSLVVTGNPRYDHIQHETWVHEGTRLLERLGMREAPLLFLSNPIDDQGFCSTSEKLELFGEFAREVSRRGVPLLVKLHPREDVAAFERMAARCVQDATIQVVSDASLFAVLAAGRAAVVLASTVGLEALMFGVPLGVLAIPGHGHVFEYVSNDAAVPLVLGPELTTQLDVLLSGRSLAGSAAMLERYLAHRGHAAAKVAETIEGVLR